MLPQVNINQDMENNMLYARNTENVLSSAIIKNVLGQELLIAWDNEEETTINTVMNKLEKTANICMDTNVFEIEETIEADMSAQKSKKVTINLEKVASTNDVEQVTYAVNNSKEGNTSLVNNIEGTTTNNAVYNANNTTTKKLEENIKTYYGISTTEAFNMQVGRGAKIQKNGKWVTATSNEIKQYFMPSQENINKYKFQFLNLASLAGISQAEAKAYLSNKGILSGKEATFIEAAKANNINEIYLMAHACLETGNGTSQLATGVSYKGKVVYNMFGIGAVDSNPVGKGAEYAYNMGWTTPESAIMGGAHFISTTYINNYPFNQDTLYEMRWNPASPGYHQYATDIAWATKQAAWMEKIYASFQSATLTFDIPVYRK